jgi:hypothetical protein
MPDYQEDEAYGTEGIDEMLDSMISEAEPEWAERGPSRGRGRTPAPRTATGRPTYQSPTADTGHVTQKQFKEALVKVGEETKRNAEGIKTVNTRVADLTVLTKGYSKRISSLDTRMRLDAALDFASAVSTTSTGLDLDLTQVIRGVVKNGALGDKGALANPWVVGGLAVFLRNPTILSGLLTKKTP